MLTPVAGVYVGSTCPGEGVIAEALLPARSARATEHRHASLPPDARIPPTGIRVRLSTVLARTMVVASSSRGYHSTLLLAVDQMSRTVSVQSFSASVIL